MTTRIAVDIGGTFTDLVYYDEASGLVHVTKVPTTPANPERGCITALEEGVAFDVMDRARYFVHGTTVGLNALIERSGAVVGMLTTSGFRDVLEIRNGTRDEPYNLRWRPRPPLVSRDLRLGVRERCRWDGAIETPLHEQDVLDALTQFVKLGVNSIAIVFLHSYANPQHEIEAARILRAGGYTGDISMSHRVSGEYRDYERASTTAVDAFVRARMADYLDRVETALTSKGFSGTSLMMRSGTGSMTFAAAKDRPFETINSGPVGGVEGARIISRQLDYPNLITADVGGTSFDAALIVDGRPRVLGHGSIDGMPLQTDWVDVRSIGSGGGSIATVDIGGLLTVGPRSAGAEPGPACYGKGGQLPTTTDAAFYLGMLGDGRLASGLRLDRGAAITALEPLAEALSISVEQIAKGIIAIAASHMAGLIRDLAMEQGFDVRSFKLLPFGGAGPMLATQIARELSIDHIVVPPHAGNFSAWGLLGADLLSTRARTKIVLITDQATAEANDLLDEMRASLVEDDAAEQELEEELIATVDLRITGQEHALAIIPDQASGRILASASVIESQFRHEYAKNFGDVPDGLIEMASLRLARRRCLPSRKEHYAYPAGGHGGAGNYHSFARDCRLRFEAVDRGNLRVGERYNGPAIIHEPTTTTYVDADFTYAVDDHGCLILQREGKAL